MIDDIKARYAQLIADMKTERRCKHGEPPDECSRCDFSELLRIVTKLKLEFEIQQRRADRAAILILEEFSNYCEAYEDDDGSISECVDRFLDAYGIRK